MLTAVVLAAGEAKRMGELKQLLEWEAENTILGKTIDNLLTAEIVDEELKVVIGAEKRRIKNYLLDKYRTELKNGIIKIVENDNYQQGMMSSIKKALTELPAGNQHLLFTLADKPFIGPEIYREFYQKYLELEAEIFLPQYQGQKGHPVIIKNKFRKKVLKLKGESGLRNLFDLVPRKIYRYSSDYREITVDLDFKEVYQKYRKNNFRLKNN
ncbi:MAG: nucleotidyltransferase family protein [Halanaerobiales bacterium]|nr:nucleotidyltransferase family protein [Halanaerobiales bacterium]